MSPCTSDSDIRRFAAALRGQSLDEYNAQDEHLRRTAERQVETALQVTGFVMGTPLPWNNKQADATGPWPSLFAVHPSVAVVVDREGDWWRRTGESWHFGSSWELFDKKTEVWRAYESAGSTSCFAPFSTVEANMKRHLKQSSLGTEFARTAMESVSPEHARRIAEEAARRAVSDAPSVIEGEKKADPFKALHDVISFSSMDFGTASDVAWMYGIVVGWDNDDPDEDEDPHAAMRELSQRFNWPHRKVQLLRDLHVEWVRRTSAPVAPARAGTGPFPRIEDVPTGVRVVAVDAAGNWKVHGYSGRDLATNIWVGEPGWKMNSQSRDWANLFSPFVIAEVRQ